LEALEGETISTASMKVRERFEGEADAPRSETMTVDLVPLEREKLESEDTEMAGFSSRGALADFKEWLWPPLAMDSFG
jgi:hypothetical protein